MSKSGNMTTDAMCPNLAPTRLASARQWCGSKGAYNRPSYPCHYCTSRGGLLRQGAVDKAKADDQRHAGEHQHHHLQVRKAVGGKHRRIVHDTLPEDVPVISRSEPAEGSAGGLNDPTRFDGWYKDREQPTLVEQAHNRDHKCTDPCGQTKKQRR